MTVTKKAVKEVAKNLLPRMVCVIFALFFWVYVVYNSTPDYEKSFSDIAVAPINAMVLDDHNLTVYGDVKATVEVVVYGARGDITAFSSDDISATIDFIGITEAGEHMLPIKIELPDGAAVKSYSPKVVKVNVQEIAEKEVPLLARPHYSTSYIKGEAYCTNFIGKTLETVKVSGPASELRLVDHVEARPSYDGMLNTSTTTVGVPLVACTKDGAEIKSAYIGIVPATVTVEIPLYDEKELNVKVEADNDALGADIESVTVSPSRIKVRKKILRGEALDKVNEIVVARFGTEDIKGENSTEKLILPVELGAEYENLSGYETVNATVSYRKNSNTVSTVVTFKCPNINIANPLKKNYELLTDSVEVSVRVPKATAAELANTYNAFSAFSLSGSLAEEKGGKVKVTLNVPSKYGDEIVALGEYYVEVSIGK